MIRLAMCGTDEASARHRAARLKGEGHSLELCKGVHIACIGPVTAQAVQELGLRVDVLPYGVVRVDY